MGRLRPWLAHGAAFDPTRANNLDLVRFVAASMVLVDHSFALTGRHGPPGPFGYETLGAFGVAVFFVISGYLVTASWQRDPRVVPFARKRAFRIVPAFAFVVVLCALVAGPVLTTLSPSEYFTHPLTRAYLRNLAFWQVHYMLPGVFATNPFAHAVNGSIWTLPIEVTMYVLLATLGALRLLTRASVSVFVAALSIAWFAFADTISAWPPFGPVVLQAGYTVHLALWFFLGSAFWLWRDRIRYRLDVAAALALGCWLTQRTPAGYVLFHLALPYMLLTFATLDVRWMAHFGQRGDFSYGIYLWAFPVQQTLASFGGATWALAAYVAVAATATLGCAYVSWHVVEYPALRFKRGRPVAREPAAGDAIASP